MIRPLAVLLALLVVLGVAAVVTLAALWAGDDGARGIIAEPEPQSASAEVGLAVPEDQASILSSVRDLLSLPNLRDLDPIDRLVEGALTYLDDGGNPQTLRFVFGSVVAVSGERIDVIFNGGGAHQDFVITNGTRVLDGLRPTSAADLEADQQVLVVARGNEVEREALAVIILPGWLAGDED